MDNKISKKQKHDNLLAFLNRCAYKMSKSPTKWESILAKHLRDLGYKIKIQVPVIHKMKGYIIDFLLVDYNIVIEADGKFHNLPNQKKKDNLRTKHLLKEGYYILRFSNKQISTFSKEVIDQIIKQKIMLISLELPK